MKVFLSWSGHKSHQVAIALRDWIPSVIQSITPYVSSEDIDKGTRWSTDIAKELADSSFGILCVTKDNLDEPWLMFEAGALSKMMDKSYVCPFLFDIKMAEIKEGPILQFQTTKYEKEDIKKLLITLNKCCGETCLKDDQLSKTFEVWWPTLKSALDAIADEKQDDKSPTKKSAKEDMIEEILELSRVNQKLLRSPELLFPPDYVEYVLKNKTYNGIDDADTIRRASHRIRMLMDQLDELVNQYRNGEAPFDNEYSERYSDIMTRMNRALKSISLAVRS